MEFHSSTWIVTVKYPLKYPLISRQTAPNPSGKYSFIGSSWGTYRCRSRSWHGGGCNEAMKNMLTLDTKQAKPTQFFCMLRGDMVIYDHHEQVSLFPGKNINEFSRSHVFFCCCLFGGSTSQIWDRFVVMKGLGVVFMVVFMTIWHRGGRPRKWWFRIRESPRKCSKNPGLGIDETRSPPLSQECLTWGFTVNNVLPLPQKNVSGTSQND